MKIILTLQLFLLLTVTSFSQSADSLKIPARNYKNTIQTSLLGFGGYFGLQYERALNKDWSISLIGSYDFPFSQLNQTSSPGISKVYYEKYIIQAEVRYYLDKNKINNNGFYAAADIGYSYILQYVPTDKSNAHNIKKYSFFGATIGYQLLIKRRLVVDAGIGIQYGTKGEMYTSGVNNKGWEKMRYREIHLPITLNIGYAF
ncbi:DUF3575 domain-containing protein [Cytophaga hutchinsonii]|uniref:Outer membrane protein beta-barrel domain-containing protein n=1 Tax=Cytophaga hutchinsonii (strain ATCC 33406 / DSM 1761 / CIP 103989 / NBRC 15051 / NCIMB 9469 / D465) TaxID=269798 RepID=A0A6N4SMX9_CYTH3|nr:DUF3575 domain-containing protein [Cytophaga hutchinsonii]ABG57631.1 hypothetical protein CHU_0341 [Cytophaga hutchinsonii ATCC 33406]SFX01559.1 Protein of unknown function [Cytophaga hutchinsonii ATCC 33406]